MEKAPGKGAPLHQVIVWGLHVRAADRIAQFAADSLPSCELWPMRGSAADTRLGHWCSARQHCYFTGGFAGPQWGEPGDAAG